MIPIPSTAWLILAAGVAGSAAGWTVHGWKHDAQLLREEQIVQKAQEGAAKEIAKIEVKNVTIKQKLEREIHEKPVYRDCKHTPDGLRLINDALTGSGDSELSKADRTK